MEYPVFPPQFTPTVRPKQPYGPADEEADAAALRKAMKGFGTDEKAIIAVLANRSNQQRQLIANKFISLYEKDLVEELKSELGVSDVTSKSGALGLAYTVGNVLTNVPKAVALVGPLTPLALAPVLPAVAMGVTSLAYLLGGNFGDVVVACMTPLDQFFAKMLHHTISGLGTKEDILIEVLCSLNNAWIHAIKNSYLELYGNDLESDIKGDTSGCFERLLISLCQGMRDENPDVDPDLVAADVSALFEAAQNNTIGTDDDSTFNAILTSRSLPHLREVFDQYHQTHGVPFEKVIKDEFSGSTEIAAIVKCMTDCSNFFAERLYNSMAGAGTKDRDLIRVIVSRSEFDLGDIKVAFEQKYGKSLESFIEGDCSGDYKRILIALVSD
ncbi:annexin B9-like isoform X4 [Neocloeon triangulifer]|uniref:annexin B9-like isoform X4 n=1 Tax=Neocloeon triangulifer TaxID=2078957 RepID=UPI00286EEB6B|nr:annexin B9-like isoform X4 [Neocloeon triangulifer]